MKTARIDSEIFRQTPVRDMAALWTEGGKLITALPVIAQAVVRRHWRDGDITENEFDFVVYASDSGAELVGCCNCFPFDKYGSAWIVPCTSDQWQRLFFGSDAVLSVALEVCNAAGVKLEGWRE
jgi:hypothetical protein